MSEILVNLIIQAIGGAIGGNAIGATLKNMNLPLSLNFDWRCSVATLLLAAEDDAFLPLQGMLEIFERAASPKLMVTLKRADHLHFIDNVEQEHEAFRTSTVGNKAIQRDMKPVVQLVSGAVAHAFASGLTVAHFDAILRCSASAQHLLKIDLKKELLRRGFEILI
jgi:hypothetical protein